MKKFPRKIFLGFMLAMLPAIFFFAGSGVASAACVIQSAIFSPSGNKGDAWFKDNAPPDVKLTVTGNADCVGKTAEVSIVEDDTVFVDDDVKGIDDLEVKFPTSKTFTINLKAGETDCEQWFGNDCEYFIKIDLTGAENFSTEDKGGAGNLEYDCDGACKKSWTVGQIDRPGGDDPNTNPTSTENSKYTLLAPLPGPDEMLTVYDVGGRNQLGKYLNTGMTIFIGICAVLAMIMIIIGGLEYMTSELVSSKENGKDKITQAIFGLLLALGAWTILNTINPDLLETEMDNLTDVTLFIEGPEMELSGEAAKAICDKKGVANGQTVTSCDESALVSVPFLGGTVRVNKVIERDIRAIDAAWQASTDPKVRAYKITQLGSYNARHAINSTTPSAHAFGLALDINSSNNPYTDSTNPCKTDMPRAFVKLFTDRGFGWGGYWKSKKDAMHFSKLRNESLKYTSGTCSGLK